MIDIASLLLGMGVGIWIARIVLLGAFNANPEYFCIRCKYRDKKEAPDKRQLF